MARCLRALAAVWATASALSAGTAVAAPPTGNKLPSTRDDGPGDRPLPPPPDDSDSDLDFQRALEEALTEEEKLELRKRQFREHLLDAQEATQKQAYEEAVREYTSALRLQPGDPEALMGRAYARKGRPGDDRCPAVAINDLMQLSIEDPRGFWLEQRRVALDWMSLCGESHARRRLALAREVAAEKPGSVGRPDDIRLLVARLLLESVGEDASTSEAEPIRMTALEELERYRQEFQAAGQVPSAVGLRLQADLYRDLKQLQKASAVYEELVRLHPHTEEATDAVQIREELAFELELQTLHKTQGFRPTEAAEAAYHRGFAALRRGDLDTAEREFNGAIEESPWFPRAYHARGVAFARKGRFLQAVDDLKRAVRMDRSDYRAHMTLGLIYKKEFAGAEDEGAIKHLSAALRLRPDLHRLHLLLGELYARTDRQRARDHYERFLRLAPIDDPDAKTARKALEELEREIRQDEPQIVGPTEESLRFLAPELQEMINEAYLRGTEQQDWEEAEKILFEARDKFPNEPVVLNELARVAFYQDRLGDARQYWEQSLQMLEEQVEVHERLGMLLQNDRPDEAIPHLRRAADLGSLTARYVLAELLWNQIPTRPVEASEQLDRYLAEASDYDLHWDRALALREDIDRRFLQFYLGSGLLLLVLLAVPTWRLYRRYRGYSLRQLLERAPKSFPEVARILSLIRHEILKHNTAFLVDVGQALEVDAPDAEHRAVVLSRRLFGEHDEADGRGGRGPIGDLPAGIYGRFLGYVDELEKVGRAHRVTLNLHRKDPIFSPMIEAFEELSRRAPIMRNPHGLRPGKKLELARALTRTGDVLGRRAFERLSELIRELCVTQVDARLLADIYQQVAGEKQFEGRHLAPLQVSGVGAPVRIFRTDLEDIVTNVIRNSLRSSVLYARPPVGLGIDLVSELDEITGLGSLAIRIKDRSPEQLSNEMLRGRYVERGMGITVDLLSRYDGAIGVEAEPGWSKAVVLRFFILEDEAGALEAEAAQ